MRSSGILSWTSFLLAGSSVANLEHGMLNAGNYSTWMLESIIASRVGIGLTQGGATSQIESGLFQETLRQWLQDKAARAPSFDFPRERQVRAYLQQSISASGVSNFTNVTMDLGQPLDRLSVGRSLIVEQQHHFNRSTMQEIESLQRSVLEQPRNDNGGLWYYDNFANLTAYHNLSYLDGMFSYAPFTALLPSVSSSLSAETALHQVGEQLDILYRRCYQNETGLLVHGYDAAKSHPWANPVTGASPIVWSRSIAWYTVGLVDSLDIFLTLYPHLHSKSPVFLNLLGHLNQLVSAEIRAVEKSALTTRRNGLYQVVTKPGAQGNFVESSGTALVTYALAKAVRTGLLSGDSLKERASSTAQKMFADLVDNFVIHNANGTLSFNGTSSVASLSGDDISYKVSRSLQDPLDFAC